MLNVYRAERGDSAIGAFIMAPGAGGGQMSRFMTDAAHALAARGVVTATFDFPYAEQGRSVPDKPPVLEAAWRAAIAEARAHEAFRGCALFIGGKSMGGRMASHVLSQGVEGVAGGIYLGYPLHAPGKSDTPRDAHLPAIQEPMLFVQGTRDQFGTSDEIRALLPRLNARTTLMDVADGDHSFKVRVKIAGPQAQVFDRIFDGVAAFISRWSRPPSAPAA